MGSGHSVKYNVDGPVDIGYFIIKGPDECYIRLMWVLINLVNINFCVTTAGNGTISTIS